MEKVEKTELDKKLAKILARGYKPLIGNKVSFSNKKSKRRFKGNLQKFKIGDKTYELRVKDFRSLHLD
jgi:ribosomal protein L28